LKAAIEIILFYLIKEEEWELLVVVMSLFEVVAESEQK
jgi:hypothetical protein